MPDIDGYLIEMPAEAFGGGMPGIDIDGYVLELEEPPSPFVFPALPRQRGKARSVLGVDIDAVFDITPHFQLSEGVANLGRALARRLSTPRGALSYDLDYGLDLRQYLHADVASAAVANMAAAVAAECEKDRRVRQARVALAYDPALERLRVTVRGVTAEGPFELVLSADDNAITIESIGRLGNR